MNANYDKNRSLRRFSRRLKKAVDVLQGLGFGEPWNLASEQSCLDVERFVEDQLEVAWWGGWKQGYRAGRKESR